MQKCNLEVASPGLSCALFAFFVLNQYNLGGLPRFVYVSFDKLILI